MRKWKILVICLTILMMVPCLAKGGDSVTHWKSIRLNGLKQYRDGNTSAALVSFNAALGEAQKAASSDPSALVLSTCDLATFYELEGKTAEALKLYEQAIVLNKKVSNRDSEVTNYLVVNYAWFLRQIGKADQATSLEAQFGSDAAETLGEATMTNDFTINMRLMARGSGLVGTGNLSYPIADPDYDSILLHLGLLKPDQSKFVTPWPDKG